MEPLQKSIRRQKIAIWVILGICIILSVYVYAQGLPPPPHKYDALAKCISEASATFYGAFWCPHCAEQKTKFGTGAQYLPYVECSLSDHSENATCKAAGVKNYPTWMFADSSTLVGVQSPSTLSQKTGCPLPSST